MGGTPLWGEFCRTPKGVDREGPRKEDARKEDPEPLEHDLITPFKTPLNLIKAVLKVVQELLLIILVMPLKGLDLS